MGTLSLALETSKPTLKKMYLKLFLVGFLASATFAQNVQTQHLGGPTSCAKKVERGDTITAHYSGTLTDGTKFDSSYDSNQPLTVEIGVGRVIKGWDVGMIGMCPGEKRRLVVPPELGYGDRGAGNIIPGGATLIFEVELVAVQ